jgi:hypothetical protein
LLCIGRRSIVRKIISLWEAKNVKYRRHVSNGKSQIKTTEGKQNHSTDTESSQRQPRASTTKATLEAAEIKGPRNNRARNRKRQVTVKEKVFDKKVLQVNSTIRWLISESNNTYFCQLSVCRCSVGSDSLNSQQAE